jgi:hypothetical protein
MMHVRTIRERHRFIQGNSKMTFDLYKHSPHRAW